ncbi:MAG: NUDIX domain-containing protein [Opitutales bacterium]
MADLPFKISVLVFLRDAQGRLLLIKRRKAPNLGCWSPIGGKLEMALGESPFECAIREVGEETGISISDDDLHLFGYISEKAYEGDIHWLMFLFDCRTVLDALPEQIDEGHFAFFTRGDIDTLPIPETDRTLLWPNYDAHRDGFIALRANCDPAGDLTVTVEQRLPGT